jgi:Bacterial protein of unknown function (DUF899)
MTEHRIGTQEEWQAERDELLKEEKALTRRGDEQGAEFVLRAAISAADREKIAHGNAERLLGLAE